jgi:hypothetical protein
MATIVQTSIGGKGARAAAMTTMTASDTLAYQPGTGQLLHLRNPTGGALTPVFNGSLNDVAQVTGGPDVSTTSGLTLAAVPATTGSVVIPLDTIAAYLKGTITITGCTGMVAVLLGA